MRSPQRLLLSLPLLLLASGMAAGCHSTVPSLLLSVDDPTGLAPTQLRVIVSLEDLETHDVTRPEVPDGALVSPQTLRLFLPDEAVGQRVDLTVEALRDGVVIGSAVTVAVIRDAEDTRVEVALVPLADPDVCNATTCPSGCCDGNVCIEGAVRACGAGGGACGACDETSTDQCVEGNCRCGADGPCPAGYRCEAGACAPTAGGQSCSVDEQCQTRPGQCFAQQGRCNEHGKCEYAPLPAGEGCDDPSNCTEGDQCDGQGLCVSTREACNGPTGQCLEDVGECVNGTCHYATRTHAPCGTNDACTTSTCDASGQCVSSNTVCDPPSNDSGCFAVSCHPQLGCQTTVTTGAGCQAANACVTGTTCQPDGTCGGGTPKACPAPPNTLCWDPPTCDPGTGACTQNRKDVGTPCGVNDACQTNVCNDAGQCVRSNAPEGQVCGPDCGRCAAGVCQGCGAGETCCGMQCKVLRPDEVCTIEPFDPEV